MLDRNETPDFINDIGTRWWLDKNITKYAKDIFDQFKIKKCSISAFYVETKDTEASYVLIIDNKIVAQSKSIDGIGSEIDKQAVVRSFK